jgi:hypothetical protein
MFAVLNCLMGLGRRERGKENEREYIASMYEDSKTKHFENC